MFPAQIPCGKLCYFTSDFMHLEGEDLQKSFGKIKCKLGLLPHLLKKTLHIKTFRKNYNPLYDSSMPLTNP